MLHISAAFEAVYFLNGLFTETPRAIRHDTDRALFVTVLPLSAALLPYTVMVSGTRVAKNGELCSMVTLNETTYLLRVLPRYNYVYSAKPPHPPSPVSLVCDFFAAVKQNRLQEARDMMSGELSRSVDDRSLTHFFDEYTDMVKNDGYLPAPPESYFFVNESGTAALFTFNLKYGKIDDIVEQA